MNRGSSSASRVIWGLARGVAAAASLPVFLGAVVVAGQYPGPVSAPSLRAMRTTSKSLVSAMAGVAYPMMRLWMYKDPIVRIGRSLT